MLDSGSVAPFVYRVQFWSNFKGVPSTICFSWPTFTCKQFKIEVCFFLPKMVMLSFLMPYASMTNRKDRQSRDGIHTYKLQSFLSAQFSRVPNWIAMRSPYSGEVVFFILLASTECASRSIVLWDLDFSCMRYLKHIEELLNSREP